MQTQCPHCHTLFRITESQLAMAEGRVRCGFCKQVFNAGVDIDANDDNPSPLNTYNRQQGNTRRIMHFYPIRKVRQDPEIFPVKPAPVMYPTSQRPHGALPS